MVRSFTIVLAVDEIYQASIECWYERQIAGGKRQITDPTEDAGRGCVEEEAA